MITSDQEQQVKLQFLDEATDYLDTIESGLLGLGAGAVTGKELDALLRAAHSIKGGAAMMGYTTLAKLGHQLEDYFKIIQYGRAAKPDSQLEQLLLSTLDRFRQIITLNRQGQDADPTWLASQVQPIFDRLRERLGEFNPEDEANMLAAESGEDILSFLFESEVERCLEQLESIVSSGNVSNLHEELQVATEELGGLAEMVELPAMASFCQSVLAHLAAQPHQVAEITTLALAGWRRTQAMVLIGQTTNLPSEIELPGSGIVSLGDDEPEWSNIDLHQIPLGSAPMALSDFDLDSPLTIADLDGNELTQDYEITVEWHPDASYNEIIADPFTNNITEPSQPFSTITASEDLDEGTEDIDDADLRTTMVPTEAEDVEIHFAATIAPIEDEQLDFAQEEINAFERLDLSGDLALDTDASELFSALSGLQNDAPENASVFPVNQKKAKNDDLDRQAAELFEALDAAPEIAADLHHHHHSNSDIASTAPVADQTIRVATKQLEQIGDLFGELTIDRNGLNLQLRSIRGLVASLQLKVQQLEESNERLRSAYDGAAVEGQQPAETLASLNTLTSDLTERFDLLEFDRYSDLHLLSQEVMDTIVQIEEITTDLDLQLNDTERTTRDLNRTANQLQTGLTQVRMRPISELFNRFPRAIRSLSIEHSKPIDLQLKGGATLIERSILEALNDPLMHLLRNGFDHGIEPTAVRRANGKPDLGTIEMNATYRGNQTVITIKDDGGGIDLDKIRAKVKKMGVDDKEIANFTDTELINLIFEPGFSTAAKVTDLSGRGVGMDVVRTNIRAQRGDISVDTKLGKGTTFTITVPFTLSVVRVLLVEVNGLWLAIPSNIIEEIILLDPGSIITTAGQKMLQWEGFTVRLIQPKQYLHLPHFTPQLTGNQVPTIDCPTVLMVDQGQDIVAIEIDKFWGEQEVTVRQPHGNIKMPPGFTGCTILGDGRVIPLVDAIELIRWIDGDTTVPQHTTASILSRSSAIAPKQQQPTTDSPKPSPIPSTPTQRPRILVVDDSINVRRFVALTLEKVGYQVEQAKDGSEAVEKLQSGLSVQAVVCDIEMPRMDGYGFLATVKGQPQFKHIPVLMLTSRSGDKHRKIAMNLGATGYFSKPFKEQELLATLSGLVR